MNLFHMELLVLVEGLQGVKGCWFVLCALKGFLCAWQVSQDTLRVPVMWAHDLHSD